MRRLIKGFAVGILCLQWSLPASAQAVNVPVCGPVIANPLPLINTSSTELNATGVFRLTCSCPKGTAVKEPLVTGTIMLSIVLGQSVTRNGLASIRLSNNGDDFVEGPIGGSYDAVINYDVNVSTPDGDNLQVGSYSVAVEFKASELKCSSG